MFYGFSVQGYFAVRYLNIFQFTFARKEDEDYYYSHLGEVSYRFHFHSFLGRLLGGQTVAQHLLCQFPDHCGTLRKGTSTGLTQTTMLFI